MKKLWWAAVCAVFVLASVPGVVRADETVTFEGTSRLMAADFATKPHADAPGTPAHSHPDAPTHDVYRRLLLVGDRSYTLVGKTVPHNELVRVTGTLRDGDVIDVASFEITGAKPFAFTTSGTTHVLAMLAWWSPMSGPDSVTQASATTQLFGDSNGWYRDASYNALGQTGDVTPWMQVTGPADGKCFGDSDAVMAQAKTAAANLGYTLANYDNFILYFPSAGSLPGSDCNGSAGWAYVGSPGAWLNGTMNRRTSVHEQGHNYGLYHAHTNLCPSVIGDPCTYSDYGNPYNIMGSPGVTGHFGAAEKNRLGWLGSRLTDLTNWGSASLVPMANDTTAVHAAKITASATRTYWLEYRQPVDFDSVVPSHGTDGVLVNVTGDGSGTFGTELTQQRGASLLDTRPSDGLSGTSATVRPGGQWVTPEGYAIRVTSATTAGAGVTVAPVPTLGIALSPDAVRPGDTLQYVVPFSNKQSQSLSNVTVNASIPANTTYVPNSATCGGTVNGSAVRFVVASMSAGQLAQCTFQVTVNAGAPVSSFAVDDNLDAGNTRWSIAHQDGSADWALSTASPRSGTHAFFASAPAVVSDQLLTLTNPVTITPGATLHFMHKYGFEAGYDGGLVEISTNNGATWEDLGPQMTSNGYTRAFSALNRNGFTGTTTTYARTVVDLSPYAGTNARIRFRAVTDSTVASTGWHVDDIQLGQRATLTSLGDATATQSGGIVNVASHEVTVLPAGVAPPGAPTIGTPTPGNASAVVPFTAPASNGGSPITGYSVTASPGGWTQTAAANATSVNFTGLSNGVPYTFTVKAANAHGTGSPSAASNAVVPFGAVSFVYPTDSAKPVKAVFTSAVKGVSTANFVLTTRGTTTKLAKTTLKCFDATNKTVACTTNTVRSATLLGAYVPGQYYNAQINPASVAAKVKFANDTVVAGTFSAFRAPVIVEEKAPTTYKWVSVSDSGADGGSYVRERNPGASATYAFTGSAISWRTITGPDQGRADVYIDNAKKATVDNYSAQRVNGVTRSINGLSNAKHTLRIVVAATKNPAASATWISVDGIRVGTAAWQPTPTLGFTWASGGTYAFSNVTGSEALLTFRGTGIAATYLVGPDKGRFVVLVDGAVASAGDAYAATPGSSTISVTGLADGVHTVSFYVALSKHELSTDTVISLDRWTIT